jgi:hypothetical protein
MKKIFGLMAVLGLVGIISVFVQPNNAHALNFWERLMTPNSELRGLDQTAATVNAVKMEVVDVDTTKVKILSLDELAPEPEPSPVTSGCGQTTTPLGKINETIRCDGRNWVAASNLLNSGTNVAIGAGVSSSATHKFSVLSDYIKSSIHGSNIGDGTGVSGVATAGNGVVGSSQSTTGGAGVLGQSIVSNSGIGVSGIAGGPNSVGVVGVVGGSDSNSNSAIAVKAQVNPFRDGGAGYGFYQGDNINAKNYFSGRLGIGAEAMPGEMLRVSGSSAISTAITVWGPGGLGIESMGHTGIRSTTLSNDGTGLDAQATGSNNTALRVYQGGTGRGLAQEGADAKNIFEGKLGVGTYPDSPTSQRLEVNGGVKLDAVNTSKPACAAGVRGTFWFVKGASGVADTAEVCAKNADGSYVWKNLF